MFAGVLTSLELVCIFYYITNNSSIAVTMQIYHKPIHSARRISMTGSPVSEIEKLRDEIHDKGLGRLPVAQAIGMAYSTLGAKLCGYIPATDEEIKAIKAAVAKLSKKS
jgi:hypothetical protein